MSQQGPSWSHEPHKFDRFIVSYPYCSKCGLIRLKNPLTDWCASKGCNYDEHPSYRQKVKKFTERK